MFESINLLRSVPEFMVGFSSSLPGFMDYPGFGRRNFFPSETVITWSACLKCPE